MTGKRDFLEPYRAAASQVDASFDELGQMVADDPRQVQRIRDIRSTYAQWADQARGIVGLEEAGNFSSTRVGEMTGGKRLMDRMRKQFDSFIGIEGRNIDRERWKLTSFPPRAPYPRKSPRVRP